LTIPNVCPIIITEQDQGQVWSRTLDTAPADPEINLTKTRHAKSQRIAVTESKRIATQVYIWE
jgi:hypothetical protein